MKYYYEITQGKATYGRGRRRVLLNTVGHLLRDENDDKFLCGEEKPTLKYHNYSDYALSGRKVCEACIAERERLTDPQPNQEELSNWWDNGKEKFRERIGE